MENQLGYFGLLVIKIQHCLVEKAGCFRLDITLVENAGSVIILLLNLRCQKFQFQKTQEVQKFKRYKNILYFLKFLKIFCPFYLIFLAQASIGAQGLKPFSLVLLSSSFIISCCNDIFEVFCKMHMHDNKILSFMFRQS